MACGCGAGRKSVRSNSQINKSNINSSNSRGFNSETRTQIAQNLNNNQIENAGFSEDRKRIQRLRRAAIQNALGR